MKKAKNTFPLVAKTVPGLEQSVADELLQMGAGKIKLLNRAVSFEGDTGLMYRANYCSRTALRILKPILEFEVENQEKLYEALRAYRWEDLFGPQFTFAIDSVVHESVFTHSQFVSQRSKDAIVDRLREVWGRRPSVDLDEPDLRLNVHIQKKNCTVSLDSSGGSLHKRGYRKTTGPAPLNEVLAAGMVLLSGWDKRSLFMDPMCGSGTLLIEAAMMTKNIPAGFFRKDFGFTHWNDFDAELWHGIKEKADAAVTESKAVILGSDRSPQAIRQSTENLRFAKLQDDIRLQVSELEALKPPEEKGWVVTNPPYDERMQVDDLIAFYKKIGDVFKKKFTGYQAWVISSDLKALKFIGLHPSRKIILYNGPLECRFVKFELY
ncbi:MAG TPA: THUMP domain-containing protein [Bacteroidales bacterium]|nr:THUMP domain-containing protein [Bacteroidales bacterium]